MTINNISNINNITDTNTITKDTLKEMTKSVNDAKMAFVRSEAKDVYIAEDGTKALIHLNPRTEGYMCTFKHKGEYYTADLSFFPPANSYECIICKSDNDGNISNWKTFYTAYEDECSAALLDKHIHKFADCNDK